MLEVPTGQAAGTVLGGELLGHPTELAKGVGAVADKVCARHASHRSGKTEGCRRAGQNSKKAKHERNRNMRKR